MTGARFTPGTPLWVDGRAATVITASDLARAQVRDTASGETREVDLGRGYFSGQVTLEPPGPVPDGPPRALLALSPQEERVARERLAMVAPLLEGPHVEQRVQALVAPKRSRATLYRWKLKAARGLTGLAPGYGARGGVGRTRLPPEREALLGEVIETHYMQRTRPSLRHVFEQLGSMFAARGWPRPGLHTLRDRIDAVAARRRTKAREGTQRARAQHGVSRGRAPQVPGPLHTILIDHTPLDIHVVDAADRTRVLGRPYLTLAMDQHTRMVYGYYLSLDKPSYLSVAMVLLQGVLPKDDLVRQYDLKTPWPIYGLPSVVYTDNGMEFWSRHLELLAASQHFELSHRPVMQPQYGALIERVIGTVVRYVHPLPGTTKSSIAARGDYDAERGARYTLDFIERFLARRIVEHYHTRVHGELGKPPLAAWEEAQIDPTWAPRVPRDPTRFLFDILPYEERTIQKEGVELWRLHYTHDDLHKFREARKAGKAAGKYTVRFDPRDISTVYFVPPDGSPVLPLHPAGTAEGSFSLVQLHKAHALADLDKRAFSNPNLNEFLQREQEELAAEGERTRTAQREAARQRRNHSSAGALRAKIAAARPGAGGNAPPAAPGPEGVVGRGAAPPEAPEPAEETPPTAASPAPPDAPPARSERANPAPLAPAATPAPEEDAPVPTAPAEDLFKGWGRPSPRKEVEW